MRIAIFHNFLDNIGGAEIVTLTLAKELGADVYTTNIDREKIRKMGFSGINIYSIGRVPINAPLRQQVALLRFRKLKLGKKYDFYIIGGDWAMSGAVNNHPNLWYVHSPIREIWDAYEYTRSNIVPWKFRPIFDLWVKLNRHLNRKYIKHVDGIVCNSLNTKKRLKNFLNIDAEVVYPPTDTKNFYYRKAKNYWLSVNRLLPPKRIDMQIRAFEKMPEENLVIVGCYEKSRNFLNYKKYIERIKPKNVRILNWVDDKKLKKLYAECKGLVMISMDEDFGMSPVEAMASGKPVIAANEGGLRESVINGETGILIDEVNGEKLIKAIEKIDFEKYKGACLKRAKDFDKKVFIRKIRDKINEIDMSDSCLYRKIAKVDESVSKKL
jgi:glycosyltransferase involved in cell wall biosynthesis